MDSVDGDKIFKIEYKNAGFLRSKDSTDYANVQLWLYEESNVFEIHYGEIKADTSAWLQDIGAFVAIGKDEQNTLVLLGGNSSNPKFLISRDTFLLDIPAKNLVYRFTPLTVGLGKETFSNNVEIYPNLSTDFIYVNLPFFENFEYEIYSIIGNKIESSQFDIDRNAIDVNKLANGIYYLIIRTNHKKHYLLRIKGNVIS
ncbi:MAG: T9SS type A sorting domain-containing protein [bacterium]|nr:T9SS type A sorting domain-containing protein [bacterium]